jgi:enoyl-CoA hydratase/carnithine racemase
MSAEKKFKYLKLEKQENEAVWIVSIDNPPANTLSQILLDELDSAVDSFDRDGVAKVLVLTGAGERAFCAGADINEIIKIDSPETGERLAVRGQKLCDRIENLDKPIIAAINALCLGGGNEIAMACHIRIASENAKFGQPEISIGIIPGFGGTQRLLRLIGESQARKLILTGDTINATEAHALGLVDEVVEKGKALFQAIELTKRIIRNSQVGVKLSQRALREGGRKTLAEGLKIEIECFRRVCESEDMKEGGRAFKEKRPPFFKDR